MIAVLPRWLETEETVRRTFELLGFEVERISIAGRQIDLIARRHGTFDFSDERWVIEITTERVGKDKGGTDSQKLLIAKKGFDKAECLLISTAGFTDDQRASLKILGIHALTYTEFESKLFNLRRYAINALAQLEKPIAPDIGYHKSQYVEPEIEIREDRGAPLVMSGDGWILRVLSSEIPSVCALLGNLGTGKTSLLQRALEVGCQEFLVDSDNSVLPIFVPLGRYKQHSGDLEQMLMSEFRRVGIDTYPAAFVRHLIDTRRIVLLLDGLDEVHPIQNKDDVLATVAQLLISVGNEAAAVISCRRQFLETSDEEMAYFGPYTAGKLHDLQTHLAMRLRGHPTTYVATLRQFDRPRINQYLYIRCLMKAEDADAFFGRFYGFEDMAQTPILLAMMATAIEEGLIDPAEEELFPLILLYSRYTDRWIERDVGRAKLSPKQRRELSEAVAVHMIWSGRESENWEYLVDILRKQDAWQANPLANDEVELDVRKSGFLIRDLDDRYRFIHRSIMEYFAAVVELRRFAGGERPRHFPTDGFRLFLAHLIAADWARTGRLPFQDASWKRAAGDAVVNAQMSLLAAATNVLPIEARVVLSLKSNVSSSGPMKWRRTNFVGFKWVHVGSDLELNDCWLSSMKLEINNFETPRMVACGFENVTVNFDRMPEWKEPSAARLDAPQVRLEIPGFVWDLSLLVEDGAKVCVLGSQEWRLTWSQLFYCSIVVSRLRGKVQVNSFLAGPHVKYLRGILPNLLSAGWVEKYEFRLPHQLFLAKKTLEMIGKLATEPLEVQDEFKVFALPDA